MRLDRIQLEITVDCDLFCHNCCRQCTQFPSTENMSLSQVAFFVRETRALNRKWQRIDITGGEPFTHPKLHDIIEIISPFRHQSHIRLLTNGMDKEERIAQLPSWLTVQNSHKNGPERKFFDLMNKAPIDFGHKGKPCRFVTGDDVCGVGLSRYGYYTLGSCGAIDRAFGFDIGIKKLEDVTESSLRDQMDKLCDYCGHSPTLVKEQGTRQFFSKSWLEAKANYGTRPLTLYGCDQMLMR